VHEQDSEVARAARGPERLAQGGYGGRFRLRVGQVQDEDGVRATVVLVAAEQRGRLVE